MTLNFDHIVYFTKYPNEMKKKYGAQGFYGVSGGTHDVWGTYNTLIHFGLKYIEFLGIKNLATFEKYNEESVDYTLMSSIYKENYREGVHSVALRTTDIEAVATGLKKKGFLVDGPTTFSRTRGDGTVVNWKLLFMKDKETNVPLPFIIDWGMSDETRLEELREAGLLYDNGDIIQIDVATRDVKTTISKWQDAFNLEKMDGDVLQLGDMKLTFNDEIDENQVIIYKDDKEFII